MSRRACPSDVSDDEWGFVAPCLSLLPDAAAQRVHDLREVFNALRYVVRTGCPWRWLPNDLPPWLGPLRAAVYQQTQRWLRAGVFEAMARSGSGGASAGANCTSRSIRSATCWRRV